MERRSRKRIRQAKEKARPELKGDEGWTQCRYIQRFDASSSVVKDNVRRESALRLSEREFIERYERPAIPVVICDLTRNWPGAGKWTPQKLCSRFRNQPFKCGEDDDGYSVKLKMKYFVDYMKDCQDDSPLYIFDASYGEHPKKKKLLNDYEIPKYFKDDLFQYVGEKRRPPYRS
jgi:histone arginine demethylase JMJD6